MKPEDIRARELTSSEWDVRARTTWCASFGGPDAQQYAEEHAQKLRDKLPQRRWEAAYDALLDCAHLGRTWYGLPHAQKIADLLNELEP